MSDSLKSTWMATVVGTFVGTGLWLFGLDVVIWPAHRFLAQLVVGLIATVFARQLWLSHLQALRQHRRG